MPATSTTTARSRYAIKRLRAINHVALGNNHPAGKPDRVIPAGAPVGINAAGALAKINPAGAQADPPNIIGVELLRRSNRSAANPDAIAIKPGLHKDNGGATNGTRKTFGSTPNPKSLSLTTTTDAKRQATTDKMRAVAWPGAVTTTLP